MSYITDLRHFLDDDGEIVSDMPKPARELASFLALLTDAVTEAYPTTKRSIATGVSCREMGCNDEVTGALPSADEPVRWYRMNCGAKGTISGWQGTRWNNLEVE